MCSNRYYVYEYIRLDTNEPFYIGKGTRDRWRQWSGRSSHFSNIVKNRGAAVNILHDNLDEKTAYEYECWYIWQLRDIQGWPLINKTDGGEGGLGGNTIANYTEEQRREFGQKVAKRIKENGSLAGKNNPMYGNGHKISGEKNGFYGKKHNEETLDRIKAKIGVSVRAYNKNENLVYTTKKNAYNDFVEKKLFSMGYGTWKYKVKNAIKNKTELCGYYWEEVNND